MSTTRPTPDLTTDTLGADAPTSDEERDALEAAGVLGRAATAFRHALDDVHDADDEAWTSYSDALADATRRLEAELLVAQAQLAAERAQRPEAVHDALATAGEALQERIDTLRVRAHLGRMDVASGVALAVDDLDRRVGEVRDASRRARYTTTSNLEEARQAARVVLSDIVDLLRLAAAVVSDDLPPSRSSGERR